MAAYSTYSQSLRLLSSDPVTPLHSPHHSLNSSISSRSRIHTPLQPLTLHEYRKQQNSPALQLATPPGKTLRRRAALNELERTPSTSSAPSASHPPARTLPISLSAQQLTYQSLPPSPPLCGEHHSLLGQPFRSQSAEPFGQLALRSQHRTAEKVRKFKPIKRLPKPPVASGFGFPSPIPITPTPSPDSPGYTSFLDDLVADDSEQLPSAVSLSQLHPSPPLDEEHAPSPQVITTGFATNAPETPPATPAVIHYRGASFDLVNPHDSLCFANIVTPSRDFDSTDYLPLPSSDDQLETEEMGPKRALYDDLRSAHSNIHRRRHGVDQAGDAQTSGSQAGADQAVSTLNFPMPPSPAAHLPLSPVSPVLGEGMHSPQLSSVFPSSSRSPSETRFSLRHLTRRLTNKFGKLSTNDEGQELQDLSRSPVSLSSARFEGNFPRPLEETYPEISRTPTSPYVGESSTSIVPVEATGTPALAPHEENRQSFYPSSSIYSDSRPQSYFIQEPLHYRSRREHENPLEGNTDTLGQLIDHYHGDESPIEDSQQETAPKFGSGVSPEAEEGRKASDSSSSQDINDDGASLAGPFEYDELLATSPYFTGTTLGVTTYGDTRQLLQISEPNVALPEPSSSYAQQDAYTHAQGSMPSSPVSQEALDEADRIFGNVPAEPSATIPAMWSRDERLQRKSPLASDPEADWETVRASGQSDPSGESIADYSSDDDNDRGSRDSKGFPSKQSLQPDPLKVTKSPTLQTLPTQPNPFTASPPTLGNQAGPSTPWVNRGQLSDKETQELLASGPNDDIIYDQTTQEPTRVSQARRSTTTHASRTIVQSPQSSPSVAAFSPPGRERSQGSILPRETAQTPPSLASRRSSRIPTGQFYATSGRTSSVTRVPRGSVGANPFLDSTDKNPSQSSLLTKDNSPAEGSGSREDEITPAPRRVRRESRAAVIGQTRLRQMTLVSAHSRPLSARDSRTAGSDQPSTHRTSARDSHVPSRTESVQRMLRGSTVHEDAPRLLRPQRAVEGDQEKERSFKSWMVFAAFCLLPPLLLLYRAMADYIIIYMTNGRLTHAAERPKKLAVTVGVLLSIGTIGAILTPILIARSMGVL